MLTLISINTFRGSEGFSESPSDSNDMTLNKQKAKALYQKSGNIKEARRMSVRIQENSLTTACLVLV